MPHKTTPPEIRFWKKVRIGKPEECWPWIGDKNNKGYGRFDRHPKRGTAFQKRSIPELAHRLAFEFAYRPIAKGMECCHKCDNKPCCNPSHLFIGTHRDNMVDCKNKGRLSPVRGERQWCAKLTEGKVRTIRSLASQLPETKLAIMFGVTQRAIQFVIKRTNWKHVA